MIFSTFSQIKAFYMVILFACLAGLVVNILKIVLAHNHSNIVFKNIYLFFHTLIYGFAFTFATNLYNFGEFNVGLLGCFLLVGYLFHQITKKLVDFFSLKVYYIYIKIIKWEKNRIAKKLCSIED